MYRYKTEISDAQLCRCFGRMDVIMDPCELVSLVTAISCGIAKCVPQEDLGLVAAIFSQVSSTLAAIALQQEKNNPKDTTNDTDLNASKSIPCKDLSKNPSNDSSTNPCNNSGINPCNNSGTPPRKPPYNNPNTYPYTNPFITPYSPYPPSYSPFSVPGNTPNTNQNTTAGNNSEVIPIAPNPEIVTE